MAAAIIRIKKNRAGFLGIRVTFFLNKCFAKKIALTKRYF
jgi:hypothetical protein